MAFSAIDAIDLASSIVGLAGAGISVGAFFRKRAGRVTTPMVPTAALPIYSAYPPAYQPQQIPQQAPLSPSPLAAPPPPYVAPPSRQSAQPLGNPIGNHQSVVNHPLVLSAAAIGILTILFYSLEYFVTVTLKGQEGIPQGSPLTFFNAVLLTVNLICTFGSLIAMVVIAARTNARNWLIASSVLLLVGLCSVGYALGFFSVVALVPAVFFGLSAPIAAPHTSKPAAF